MNEALNHLQEFVAIGKWGYHPTGPNSAEPAAFAALALCAGGMLQHATPLANWLEDLQKPTGSVGVTAEQTTPAWPTSLAILAWQAHDLATGNGEFAAARKRALAWTLETQGKVLPKRRQIGHDTTLLGWSWAENTHSWLEPTCFFVLALKAMGQTKHTRTRTGVRMVIDRLHESGGCNYGNTVVLGQSTLPHIQPTGLAMLAVADESSKDPRIDRSLEYLAQAITQPTATASLCYALLGLTAHGRRPSNANVLLESAFEKDSTQQILSCYKLALLALAEMSDPSWLPQYKHQSTLTAMNVTKHA